MLSKGDTRKKAGGSSGNGKFLSDLETISKAYYVDTTRSRLATSTASSRSKSVGKFHSPEPKVKPEDAKKYPKDSFDKDKKSSIWSWKSLKALTHVRNRRFNCCFSLLVHSIEGLPAFFDDTCLVVHWKRRDGEQRTCPVKVYEGVAMFEEQLTHSCSVYGSRSGPHHSTKYEAKHFLLYVSLYNSPELDLGKHRVDLTRLLPLTLEELEEEKSSGKWTTSFRLSGQARGAAMNVSFGYVVTGNNSTDLSCNKSVSEVLNLQQNSAVEAKIPRRAVQMNEVSVHQEGSLAAMSASNQSAEDVKDLHEVLPVPRSELSDSVNILYQKLDEEMSNTSAEKKLEVDSLSSPVDPDKVDLLTQPDAGDGNCGTECEMTDFSVTDKGIEELTEDSVKPEDEHLRIAQSSGDVLEPDFAFEVALGEDAPLHPSAVEVVPQNGAESISACTYEEREEEMSSKESLMKELEAALSCTSYLVNEGLDSHDDDFDALHLENHIDVNSYDTDRGKGKAISLDDITDSVESDFLEMLGIEHSPFSWSSGSEPESPRECLLRQFEKDALANGGLLDFGIDNDPDELVGDDPMGSVWGNMSKDFHYSSDFDGFKEMSKVENDAFKTKTGASMMADLETEALMREWGLNEMAFQRSPSSSSGGGFGSPIDIPPEDPQQLPSLAEGLGPFVQTKDGGFLRSMNPVLFRNSKSGGSLIMQVSNPVVVPAEMGSSVMDILQGLASVGIEKLSMQANKLMPLEDITGKTIQQIAWESAPSLEGLERFVVFI